MSRQYKIDQDEIDIMAMEYDKNNIDTLISKLQELKEKGYKSFTVWSGGYYGDTDWVNITPNDPAK